MNQYQESLREAARRAYENRIQSGDGGNLSVRSPETNSIWIKASGCSFCDMTDTDIVEVSLDGEVITSGRPPSRELDTHLAIYRCRPDIDAIFHCHSPWSTAASMIFRTLPSVSLPLSLKIGVVPVLDVGSSQSDGMVARSVVTLLEREETLVAFIQKRHGIFTLATNIIKAEHHAELVEDAAQIAVLAHLAGVSPEVS